MMPKVEKIVVIDCQAAGVSGDMFLGALIDLGANVDKIFSAIRSLDKETIGYKNIKIDLKQVMRKKIKATKIDVSAELCSEMEGKKLIEIVEKCVNEQQGLSEKAKQFASRVIQTLVNSEAKLHGTNLADAHLHEVGAIDTAAEIIGCTIALDDLGLFNSKIYATPVSVGGGLFKFSHGIVSSPAPATLSILRSKKFPIKGGPIETELATPTGASIIVNLVDKVSPFYPEMTPLSIGYGAGNKDFEEMPNVVRIITGEPVGKQYFKDEIAIIETNLDDVTGEIIGHTVDRLLQDGAKDVNIIPMFTKKNRPGQIFKIVANKEDVERLSRVLIEETGTLGVRVLPCERHILSREMHRLDLFIDDTKETVNVKVAKDSEGKIIRIKPEYEELKKIATRTNRPLREITEIVTARARAALFGDDDNGRN